MNSFYVCWDCGHEIRPPNSWVLHPICDACRRRRRSLLWAVATVLAALAAHHYFGGA